MGIRFIEKRKERGKRLLIFSTKCNMTLCMRLKILDNWLINYKNSDFLQQMLFWHRFYMCLNKLLVLEQKTIKFASDTESEWKWGDKVYVIMNFDASRSISFYINQISHCPGRTHVKFGYIFLNRVFIIKFKFLTF